MFFIVDTLTNNVLAESPTYEQAEQKRIEYIGASPEMAEHIEVVDMEREMAEAARVEHARTSSAQPA